MAAKTLSKKTVLKNKFIEITKESYLKSNNKIANNYFVIHRPDTAVIAAFLKKKSKKDPSKIILIRQYRHAIKTTGYELPAGYLEPKDTSPLQGAKRELTEETGYEANFFIKIGETHPYPSLLSNKVNYFLAFNTKKTSPQHLDQNEEIDVKVVTWKKALNMLSGQEILDNGSTTGLLLTQQYLQKHHIKL